MSKGIVHALSKVNKEKLLKVTSVKSGQLDIQFIELVGKLKEANELPIEYIEFIQIIKIEKDQGIVADKDYNIIVESILSLYIFSRTNKKPSEIKNWFKNANISTGATLISLKSISSKINSYKKLIQTIQRLEDKIDTYKKEGNSNKKKSSEDDEDFDEDNKKTEKETDAGRVKNKEKEFLDKMSKLAFDKGEREAMKKLLFKGILESLSTAEMYLGAMKL